MSTLTDILPTGPATPDASPRVVDVDDEEADEVFDVLSSQTRRNVYRHVFDAPATVSGLSEQLDTSLQNVSHHVTVLEEAELIEPVGRRYSEKGNEMVVYGPASDPLVFVGESDLRPRIDRSISEIVTGLGLLAGAALLTQWGVYQLFSPESARSTAIDPASYASAPDGTQGLLVWLVFEAGEPGVFFFFACLLLAGIISVISRR